MEAGAVKPVAKFIDMGAAGKVYEGRIFGRQFVRKRPGGAA